MKNATPKGQPLHGPPKFELIKEILHLREYRADAPDDYRHGGDALLFLNEMRSNIDDTLHEELIRQNAVKYSLVMTAELKNWDYQLVICTTITQSLM